MVDNEKKRLEYRDQTTLYLRFQTVIEYCNASSISENLYKITPCTSFDVIHGLSGIRSVLPETLVFHKLHSLFAKMDSCKVNGTYCTVKTKEIVEFWHKVGKQIYNELSITI